jgi:hypothetical protein
MLDLCGRGLLIRAILGDGMFSLRSAARVLGALLFIGVAQSASAATINTAAINAIFSQPSFGATPIEVAFLSPRTYSPFPLRPYNPALENIDSEADLAALDLSRVLQATSSLTYSSSTNCLFAAPQETALLVAEIP